MWPFDSGGCSAHHWDNEQSLYRYRVFNNRVREKVRYTCEHDGCEETTEEWVNRNMEDTNELRDILRGDVEYTVESENSS